MFKINSIEELEKMSKRMKWQYFEKLVAFIFEKNDFSVKQNAVLKFGKEKRQFDVIAERFDDLFLIECKKWSGNRYKTPALRRAVDEHLERSSLFIKKEKRSAIPLIVTLVEEEIKIYQGTPIIPIEKLNLFINSFSEFRDRIDAVK